MVLHQVDEEVSDEFPDIRRLVRGERVQGVARDATPIHHDHVAIEGLQEGVLQRSAHLRHSRVQEAVRDELGGFVLVEVVEVAVVVYQPLGLVFVVPGGQRFGEESGEGTVLLWLPGVQVERDVSPGHFPVAVGEGKPSLFVR